MKLVEKYIIKNNKTPSTTDKNKDIKQLGYWLSNQKTNYKNIRNQCKIFIDKYKEYF
jgi:hypothetical protein